MQAVMSCFYATNNNQPHSVARAAHPAYPQKSCVIDDHVQWSVQCADYEPREFTADFVLSAQWADPNDPNDSRCQVNMNPQLRDRFHTDPTSNRPMNPAGRTGMSGRGVLGKWGPNFAADPIVTRHNTQTGKLQVIAIKRKDTGAWALPGGMVDPGENVSATARREFEEEAGNHMGADKVLFEELVQQLFLKDNERHVYTGYVDDPRNTDNAWMETSAMHYHCNEQLASMLKTNAGDDAADVMWLDITEDMELYANHHALVMQVDATMKHQHKYTNKAITNSPSSPQLVQSLRGLQRVASVSARPCSPLNQSGQTNH